MVTRMKKANNFQIAKFQAQIDAYLSLNFFVNFSMALLTKKVLLIKKWCVCSYLKSAHSDFSDCNVCCKNKNP